LLFGFSDVSDPISITRRCRLRGMTVTVGSSSSDSLGVGARLRFRDFGCSTCISSSSSDVSELAEPLLDPSNMPCAVLPTGIPNRIALFVPTTNSSSLEESCLFLLLLLETLLGARLVGVVAVRFGRDGEVPMVVAAVDLVAGED